MVKMKTTAVMIVHKEKENYKNIQVIWLSSGMMFIISSSRTIQSVSKI